MNLANYFMKVQPQIGKWSAEVLWEKLSRAKKAIGDACSRAGRTYAEKPFEELVAGSSELGGAYKPTFLRQFARVKGIVQSQRQVYTKHVGWFRGGNRFFSRDYLWRRMRNGHLIGFATLFLASEERATDDLAYERRMQEYEAIFRNIKDVFMHDKIDWGTNVGNQNLGDSLSDYKIGKCIDTGCNGAVYEVEALTDNASGETPLNAQNLSSSENNKRTDHPLAIKMIFNFNSSDAGRVWRETRAEMVTCGREALKGLKRKKRQNGSKCRIKTLPFHPNIIQVKKAMFQKVPDHKEFIEKHPAALPHPKGLGRSSAMFLIMKRYNSTLSDLLRNCDLSYTSRVLLALQLLNGVAHLERNCVAHRDLKANNILVDTDASTADFFAVDWIASHASNAHVFLDGLPRLTIADFGCAIVAETNKGLIISEKFDMRNGAGSVQPPEINNCVPSPNYNLDYRRSDAWAAGLLLCEIFGVEEAELEDVHLYTNFERAFTCNLIKMLLKEDSRQRISCVEASRVLHLHLFGPEFSQDVSVERSVNRWILMHAAETIMYKSTQWGKDSVVYELFMNYLSHISMDNFSTSLALWQSLYLVHY